MLFELVKLYWNVSEDTCGLVPFTSNWKKVQRDSLIQPNHVMLSTKLPLETLLLLMSVAIAAGPAGTVTTAIVLLLRLLWKQLVHFPPSEVIHCCTLWIPMAQLALRRNLRCHCALSGLINSIALCYNHHRSIGMTLWEDFLDMVVFSARSSGKCLQIEKS